MPEIQFTPFPVLRTRRLVLRQIEPCDSASIFALRSNPSSMRFLDRAPLVSEAEASAFIDQITTQLKANEGITWAITLNEKEEELIGTIGFWRMDKSTGRAEIGYMLLPAFFRHGYMSEAMKAVIYFGFNTMKLHSIEANINPANTASEMLLLQQGFLKEAYYKGNFYFNGNYLDTATYGLRNAATA